MNKILLCTLVLFIAGLTPFRLEAQQKKKNIQSEWPEKTGHEERESGYYARLTCRENSFFNGIPVRSVGPTVMSGRVVDLEVNPKDPSHFYVAYASGGLWVTHNNGASFDPLFQNEMVMTIGDIAVDWAHGETIWIGTGENNSSRSSYSGFGIYKSADVGKTWEHRGLSDTQHIGRICLHPENPDVMWVAALGHLYSNSEERGIFKTTDGGITWSETLNLGQNTGAIDLVMEEVNPNHFVAASWERERKAWNFVESGPGSAVYESLDAGKTWSKISALGSGFPQGDGVGRIGLAMQGQGGSLMLYAMLDNQFERSEEPGDKKNEGLKRKDFVQMDKSSFLLLNDSLLEQFLRDNGFPEKHTAATVKEDVKTDKIKPEALSDFLANANEDLFNRPVIGAQVFRYDFTSKIWTKTHEDYLDDLVYSYGYYFSQIRVDPSNPLKLYIMGVPLLTSDDGGKKWRSINPDNVHGDHHALWINPDRPGHLINGSDGGVQISYDDGKTFVNCNTPAVGQFYAVQVDDATPYNVYGGLQDNGVWVGPSGNIPNRDWLQSGRYPFESIMGGDGMQVQVDTRNNSTIYTGFQFGNYSRVSRAGEEENYIHPEHDLGELPLRWNWQTPILLSRHQQDIFYICSNKVHRSLNRSEEMETMSGDLTLGAKKGDIPYGTITSISESPKQFGLLAVGSDDGLVHLSKDNGYSWENISVGLPKHLWVSRVVLSRHKRERIYVTLNGYRFDHFDAYIFKSEDLGKTWQAISTNLPLEPVNVILEDPRLEKVLYTGTDHGVYVTPDMGEHWETMLSEFPAVAVHDMVIQERELDLVIGTHGRSIWIADIENIGCLDTLNRALPSVLKMSDIKKRDWGKSWSTWVEAKDPEFAIPCFVPSSKSTCQFEIWLGDSLLLHSFERKDLAKGFNEVDYDLSITEEKANELALALNKAKKENTKEIKIEKADNGRYYLPESVYRVRLISGGNRSEGTWEIK